VLAAALAAVAAAVFIAIRHRGPADVWVPYYRFEGQAAAPASARPGPPRTIVEFDFTRPGATAQGWEAGSGDVADLRVANGALRLRATGPDPILVRPCDLNADDIDAVEIDLQVKTPLTQTNVILPRWFWLPEGRNAMFAGAAMGFQPLAAGHRGWPTALLVASPYWRGRIRELRCDPCAQPGDVAIYAIRLVKRGVSLRDILAERGEDFDRLSVGRELKDAIVCMTADPVEFAVDVPAGALLSYSVGVPASAWAARAGAVRFKLTATDERGRVVLSREDVVDGAQESPRWREERVPLPQEASGRLKFGFSTSPPATGAWGNPVIYTRKPPPGPRNVVIVLFDAMRAGELGCYGGTGGLSPTIDRLASSGLLFSSARATSSWTLPSTASIFTSRYPAEVVAPTDPVTYSLAREAVTFPELLRHRGYVTRAMAASPVVTPVAGYAHGFDDFDGSLVRLAETPSCSPAITGAAVSWIKANRDHRFLLYLHYMDPHAPYTPPISYQQMTISSRRRAPADDDVRTGDLPALRLRMLNGDLGPLNHDSVAWLHDLYRAEVAYDDHQLRALLDALREARLLDQTVVIVTSDHGEEFMEHGWLDHGFSLYGEVLHVPLIVWWPGARPAVVRRPVSLLDLAPTVLAAAGISPLPVMRGRPLAQSPKEDAGGNPLFSQLGACRPASNLSRFDPRQAVVEDRYKLIEDLATGKCELYDLEADPREQKDIADRAPEVLARMKARLKQMAGSLRAPRSEPAGSRRTPDAETIEQLKALGYVQ
jgi:arylsulfatase A-like enzyme